jgi:hypothetical protein
VIIITGMSGGIGVLLERLNHLEAIHLRHHEVERDYFDLVLVDELKAFGRPSWPGSAQNLRAKDAA